MPDSSPSNLVRLPSAELISIGLAVGAVLVAGYLTIVHYRHSLLVCSGVSDCETVQTSKYAEIAGVPIAMLGLVVMVVVLGLTVLRVTRTELQIPATVTIFSLVAASIMFYVYLTYLELFVIEAICQWCVASFVITVALFISELKILSRAIESVES